MLWDTFKVRHLLKTITVEPCYLELKPISLGFACFSQSFTIGYLELSYLKLPISNKEQHPLVLFYSQIYPTLSNSQLYEQIVASLESSRLARFCTVQLLVFV